MDLTIVPLTPVPTPPPDQEFDGLPVVTHEGRIVIGDCELRVYRLSDGRRVIDGADLERFFSATGD